MQQCKITFVLVVLSAAMTIATYVNAQTAGLNKAAIEKAAGVRATFQGGVVRIGWTRDDVMVKVDGMPFPPAAGLGSWAAFKSLGSQGQDAIVMGDTVVFQDEVDAAMDAAFAHGLEVTAIHNHFFYDEPKVYFMHIGAQGPAVELASAVKAVWDAIKKVRVKSSEPSGRFDGAVPRPNGKINGDRIKEITGLGTTIQEGGVIKISTAQTASMHGIDVGGHMGLTSWAAFTGNDELAAIDGDFIMTAAEVQPVLKALRKANLHVVALHNHMIGEQPAYYFTHFWGKGPADELAKGFKSVLKVQEDIQRKK